MSAVIPPPQGFDGSSSGEVADNSITDAKIAPQESTKITGLPVQTKNLDMGAFNIENTSVLGLNGVPTQGQTGAATLGNLFLDTDVQNHLSIRKNGDAVDVEAAALGIATGQNGIIPSVSQVQGERPLTKVVNELSTVLNNDDVVTLPTAVAFLLTEIINNGSSRVQIFPASGDDLGSGVNNSVSLMAGSNIRFRAYDDTNWETV